MGDGGGEVQVPDNLIPKDAATITPEMLTLIALDQAAIDAIVARVPGGAANVQDIYPVAPLQEGILFHHLLNQEGDVYLEGNLLAFADRASLDAFLLALQEVVGRHDILRTSIFWEGLDEPVQVVRRRAPIPVEWVSLDPVGGDVASQLEIRYDPRRYRIDVSEAPLLRAVVAGDPGRDRWLLRLLTHHLAMDHTTLKLILDDTALVASGRRAELEAPVPFRTFVAKARLGVSRAAHEAFFRRLLSDVDAPTYPFELDDVQGDGRLIAQAERMLDRSLSVAIRARARAVGVSPASFMHLAFALVLARIANRDDVVFGTVMFGRMLAGGADRAMGMLMNTLPMRLQIGAEGVAPSLRETHALLAQLIGHEHAPLALAQRCSGVAAPTPLFTALFNYRQTAVAPEPDGDDAAARRGTARRRCWRSSAWRSSPSTGSPTTRSRSRSTISGRTSC